MLQLLLPNTPHFFCISDTAAAADMLQVHLSCTRRDGGESAELDLDLKTSGSITEPIPIMVRDMLMLNVKGLLDAQCPYSRITLTVHCTVGQIEQLGLRIGPALLSKRYVPDWESNVLRCEKLVFAPADNASAIIVSVMNDVSAPDPVPAELPAEPEAAPQEMLSDPADLLALIAADRAILSYYEGDGQHRAADLLSEAQASAGTDQARAAQLLKEAEDVMRELITLRMKQTKAYRAEEEQRQKKA